MEAELAALGETFPQDMYQSKRGAAAPPLSQIVIGQMLAGSIELPMCQCDNISTDQYGFQSIKVCCRNA